MATKVIEKVTKKNEPELREKLGFLYKNSDLSGYYASGIETEDGKICLIKKPYKIEKNFYFAEGMAGTINEASKQAVLAAKDILVKRLNTYLKRYGLSKVSAQTFWDER